MLGAGGWIIMVTWSVAVPETLTAVIVTVDVPVMVGVPLIVPVAELSVSPVWRVPAVRL